MTNDLHDDELDAFLAEADVVEGLSLVAEGLSPAPVSASLRERILASAARPGRLARFADAVASLLDLPRERALELLDALDEPARWVSGFLPDMQLMHVEGGPAVADAITGFARLPERAAFPHHLHLGEESILVLQGRCRERDRVVGPGELVVMPAGSSHDFVVLPGPDLVYLAVLRTGMRIGDLVLNAGDPRA